MFTGIIQNQGNFVRAEKTSRGVRLVMEFLRKEKDAFQLGESISVNGVCLTASYIKGRRFVADALPETLAATNLSMLRPGERVNLERALKYGDRLGGHFVTGHVDARAQLCKIEKTRRGKNFWLEVPRALADLVQTKGSVTIEGVSLTVQGKKGKCFKVSLVPHTLSETNLGKKKPGDYLNLEADILARYLRG